MDLNTLFALEGYSSYISRINNDDIGIIIFDFASECVERYHVVIRICVDSDS